MLPVCNLLTIFILFKICTEFTLSLIQSRTILYRIVIERGRLIASFTPHLLKSQQEQKWHVICGFPDCNKTFKLFHLQIANQRIEMLGKNTNETKITEIYYYLPHRSVMLTSGSDPNQ